MSQPKTFDYQAYGKQVLECKASLSRMHMYMEANLKASVNDIVALGEKGEYEKLEPVLSRAAEYYRATKVVSALAARIDRMNEQVANYFGVKE